MHVVRALAQCFPNSMYIHDVGAFNSTHLHHALEHVRLHLGPGHAQQLAQHISNGGGGELHEDEVADVLLCTCMHGNSHETVLKVSHGTVLKVGMVLNFNLDACMHGSIWVIRQQSLGVDLKGREVMRVSAKLGSKMARQREGTGVGRQGKRTEGQERYVLGARWGARDGNKGVKEWDR